MTKKELSLVFDAETNGFNPTVVHCIAVKVIETGESYLFADQPGYLPISDGLALLESADWLVAHNGAAFDLPVINRLFRMRLDPACMLDTLTLARSYLKGRAAISAVDNTVPDMPSKLHGKHSLKAWGYRLGLLKGDFPDTTDWSCFTDEMAEYCLLDVEITALLYEFLTTLAEADGAEAVEDDDDDTDDSSDDTSG
jgi:DNA polymerase I